MLNFKEVSPLYTDFYQLTMAQAYFMSQKEKVPACFDYFFRKLPFSGGYVVFAGLHDLLQMLESLRFSASDIDFLKKQGFVDDFLDYLQGFRFHGHVSGMREGEVVFPYEPLLRVEGTLIETQLVETLLLNVVNFQSLIATKANRVRRSAGSAILSDFGLRRAQSFGAISASRAAIIGGFDNTSNTFAGQFYGMEVAGTMAHSFIESYGSELEAFRAYAQTFPDQTTLLVDTYSTLKSGIPNAIIVAKELEKKGSRLKGIRLDSGDLAYLSKKARQALDKEGLGYVKIVVSNQLDEYVVKSLLDQGAPIDVFGVGTSMIIGKPDGALDGVYKMASCNGEPTLKISENIQKTTFPGEKQVLRFADEDGLFFADCIILDNEQPPETMIHPFDKDKTLSLAGYSHESLFANHMSDGQQLNEPESLTVIRSRVEERLALLPVEHQRFHYPHIYKVGISPGIFNLKQSLIHQYNALL